MSYRNPDKREIFNVNKEDMETRRREIRSRTLERLRKARMERMQEEEENRKREQETIIGKWRNFLEKALGIWNEGGQVRYDEIIENWGSVEQFDALYNELVDEIAAYTKNPTPEQQLYKVQWEFLKACLERLNQVRGEEEKEEEATIEKWMDFSEAALRIWKKGEVPNYEAINEKWGDMAYFDILHYEFIDVMNKYNEIMNKYNETRDKYNEAHIPVEVKYQTQWKILKRRLEMLNKNRTEAGKLEKSRRKKEERLQKSKKEYKKRLEEEEKKRTKPLKRGEEQKKKSEERRKKLEEEVMRSNVIRKVEEEKRRKEIRERERALNRNRVPVDVVEENGEIGEGPFSPNEEFFNGLCEGSIGRDHQYLKIYMRNGQFVIINLNVVPPGERWSIIMKFLNKEELSTSDWNEVKNLEDTEYTNLIWFFNKSMNDIYKVEFIDTPTEITRANLSGGNFIPLVINPRYKWMKELWEEFQITESILDNKGDSKRIKKVRREPCLFYAIKNTYRDFDTNQIERVISRKYGGCGPSPSSVAKLLQESMNIRFTYTSCKIIHDTNGIKTSQSRSRNKGDIHLNMIKYNNDQHYLNGKEYRWDEGAWDRIDKWDNWNNFYNSYKGRKVNGSYLIIEGLKRGILEPMLPIERKEILELWETPLNERISKENISIHCKKLEECEKKEDDNSSMFDVIYFADTEAIVKGEYHKVYCICWKKLIKESGEISEGYSYGLNCLDEFLNELREQEGKKVVYFHNLKYDMSFFLDRVYLISRIVKGNKIYQMKVSFDKKIAEGIRKKKGYSNRINDVITFRDSYGLISLPIRAFSSAFGLGDDGEKEVFPYMYMSEGTLEEGVIENCWSDEKPSWDKKKIEQFQNNLEKKGWVHDGRWNTKEYSLFYCMRDVDILMRGFMKFEEQVMKEFGIDVLSTLTISSLAHKYFMNEVYIKEDMRLVHGPLSDFIRGSCFGGRCMSNKNELYDIKGDIVDYDACSLYPSAMHRLYIPTGEIYVMDKPVSYYLEHLMDEDQIEPTEEKFISHFICEVNINKIRNHLDFPLTCKRGVTNEYVDYEVSSNDKDAVCWSGVYTSIQLEDMIKYQGLEFTDIKNEKDNYPASGIYWVGRKSTLLSETIQHVYKRRAEMKAKKDPTQTVYKLLMNSAYGKTIQKDILTKERYFINEDEAMKCIRQNNQTALTITKMNDHCYILKMKKDAIEIASENWGLTYLGTMILAMSKRIMNEVFYAAREAKVSIYYQDTDSIHLLKKDLDKLESKFKELYGREIRGNDMGNFHVDFDPINGDSDVCSKRCIILGKKCYLDVLENSKGEQEYHVRMKGISKNAIAGVAEQHGGYVQLYEHLFNSPLHYIKFDLAKYGNCFAFDGIHPPKSLDEFSRSLHFEGKRNVLDLIKLNE